MDAATAALTLALLVGSALALVPSAYLLGLTLAALAPRRAPPPVRAPRTRFAVLVPAHNEAALLPRLLESLRAQRYPAALYRVFVVADNCADATAEVARRHGAAVYERHEPERRGKGYALQWLLERVREEGPPWDACALVDADCHVSPGFLAAADARLQAGSTAVQAYYAAADPLPSPAAALRSLALALAHHVRPRGRQALGLSSGLFGTGMVFRREVLDGAGWDAFGLAEDAEFHLGLVARGVRVDFAPEATVWGEMPTSLREATAQNLRWERGRLQATARRGLRLLVQGVAARDARMVAAALDAAIPPLSLLGAATLALLLAALVVGERTALTLSALAAAALVGHGAVGLAVARVPPRVYGALPYAPWFALWKCAVYLRALVPRPVRWARTQRS